MSVKADDNSLSETKKTRVLRYLFRFKLGHEKRTLIMNQLDWTKSIEELFECVDEILN